MIFANGLSNNQEKNIMREDVATILKLFVK